MTANKSQKQKGFTIIEVVLVLAIAGLIFLIVFLALPQLQKSRRDTQRKNDVGRVLSALENYASNNSGTYPGDQTATDAFKAAYMTTNFNDPTYGGYTVTYQSTAPGNGVLSYSSGVICGASGALTTTGAGARNVAVSIKLETGGYYCQNN